MVNCDFSGYATRNDLLCGDGRTIRKNAFKECDGQTVPLVYNHEHNDPNAVLGHAVLENREDGVYAYCTFNDTEQGKTAKELVQHGDVRSLSIYANKLKQMGSDVVHGVIRELSLVLAGANPGAYIDFVMAHGEEGEDSIYANYDENALTIYHSSEAGETKEPVKEEPKVADETKKENTNDGDEKTVAEVFESMTEEQKTVVYAMIGQALEDAGVTDDENDENVEHSEGGNDVMKHNVFDQESVAETNVLSHADQEAIINLAKGSNVGSLKAAIEIYSKESQQSEKAT